MIRPSWTRNFQQAPVAQRHDRKRWTGSEGTRLAAGFHTHVLSDVPEDTDVFFVLTHGPSLPDTDDTIYEGKL
jgi:hypothetical protein